MVAADADAVRILAPRTFTDLNERHGRPPPSPSFSPAAALLRIRHLLRTDPGGAWVAERDGAVFVRGDVGPFSPYLPSGAYL